MCNLFPFSESFPAWPSRDSYALADLTPNEWESIRLWRNEQLSILRQTTPLSFDEQQSYWEKESARFFGESRSVCFSYKKGSQTIGYGGLVHIDFEEASAEVSTLLDPAFAEPSPLFLSTTFVFLKLTEQFAKNWGLKFLKAEIFDHRIEVIRLFYQAGFVSKAYLPKRKLWKGYTYGSWQMEMSLLPASVS